MPDAGLARGTGWSGDNSPTFSNYQLDLLPSISHRKKSYPGSLLTLSFDISGTSQMEGSDTQQNFRPSATHRNRGVSHPLPTSVLPL